MHMKHREVGFDGKLQVWLEALSRLPPSVKPAVPP
jgi:hypothetical protein